MRAALADEVPVFGMCLGAQLLGVAAGGRVTKMDELYVGWPELSLLPPAADDPLFGGVSTGLGVLKWHEDMIDAPRDADLLGTTPGPGAALFRVGPSAWGSQMHLEVTPPMLLDGWLSEPRGMSEVRQLATTSVSFGPIARDSSSFRWRQPDRSSPDSPS